MQPSNCILLMKATPDAYMCSACLCICAVHLPPQKLHGQDNQMVCHSLALCDRYCPSVCDILYHTKHQEWRIAHQISQSFHWAEMADPITQLSTDLLHLLEDQELHTTYSRTLITGCDNVELTQRWKKQNFVTFWFDAVMIVICTVKNLVGDFMKLLYVFFL